MARNSKDFKDLMRQKQSSRGKHKNMEALIEKMQRAGFGESSANMLREPKGHPKMAEIRVSSPRDNSQPPRWRKKWARR